MKKKSKRIATILAVLCLVVAAFPISAFAVTGGSEGATATTTVTYTSSASYTIEIPSSISFPAGSSETSLTVSCSDNSMAYGTKVVVSLDPDSTFSSDGNFYLVNTSDSSKMIKCRLLSDSVAVTRAQPVICRYEDGGTTSTWDETLVVQLNGTSPGPGTYTGTLYFRITVE